MPPMGFEPTISTGERPQTYALNRAATGTGKLVRHTIIIFITWNISINMLCVYQESSQCAERRKIQIRLKIQSMSLKTELKRTTNLTA